MTAQHDEFVRMIRTGEVIVPSAKEFAAMMRAALNARVRKGMPRYSVTTDRSSGFITIGVARGWMDKGQAQRLNALLGLPGVASAQGRLIRPDCTEQFEYLDRCNGVSPRVLFEMSYQELMES